MPTRTSIMLGWLVLFGASFALFLVVALLAWWQRRRLVPRKAVREAERAEWAAHAAVVAQRSTEAASRAAAARERVDAAEQARTEAWQALEQAQRAHDEAERAFRAASRRGAERPVDQDGQRAVANAALAAYRRGDLSQDQLLRVWRWGSGWDPEVEQRERALLQARAAWREANGRYRAAASVERAATEQAALAEAEARALAEEADLAEAQAGVPGPAG
jgi:hypothetical protein